MPIPSSQLNPGMVISIKNELYRVESAVKVTVTKDNPFIKVRLKSIANEDECIEKNFKLNQTVDDVVLSERQIEFLYPEGKRYLFLDCENLDQVFVDVSIIADKVDYLKEGIQVNATFYGESIFEVELPQFLELMIIKTEEIDEGPVVSNATKVGTLETGARIEVPLFIEEGDIVKVDTNLQEYIQRI
jgi:elongation factor P